MQHSKVIDLKARQCQRKAWSGAEVAMIERVARTFRARGNPYMIEFFKADDETPGVAFQRDPDHDAEFSVAKYEGGRFYVLLNAAGEVLAKGGKFQAILAVLLFGGTYDPRARIEVLVTRPRSGDKPLATFKRASNGHS